jgi:hypothetical protein
MPSGDESSARVTSEIPVGIFPLDPTDEKVEVWFHESCLIWAPGVCLVPPRLVGLDEAVSDSQQVVIISKFKFMKFILITPFFLLKDL